jgi:hypothetical protein
MAYDLEFGVFTDSHYEKDSNSTGDADSLTKLQSAVTTWNDYGVDFVVGLGDTLDGYTVAADTINLANIDSTLDAGTFSSYLVIGNHDVEAMNRAQFVAATSHMDSPYYTQTINGIKCIFLGTADSYFFTPINIVGGISAIDDTITVSSTSAFPDTGILAIFSGGTELIIYTGKTPTTFTGCLRGQYGTTAVAHPNGANVWIAQITTEAQKTWLASELAGATPKIVFNHYNLTRDYPEEIAELDASTIRAILEGGTNLLAVFQGHTHGYEHEIINGVEYFTFTSMANSNPTSNAYAIVRVQASPKVIRVIGYDRQSSYNKYKCIIRGNTTIKNATL